jgi:hypothetical protein
MSPYFDPKRLSTAMTKKLTKTCVLSNYYMSRHVSQNNGELKKGTSTKQE